LPNEIVAYYQRTYGSRIQTTKNSQSELSVVDIATEDEYKGGTKKRSWTSVWIAGKPDEAQGR